ncbi:hypothetical protein HNR06_002504 [Nocardiopsis arvandica]|uniref:Uncharacterized protein n=1 Tax=Nocardiopsis sinuspersici TaxID=501010 RepID=A0A7Y9XDS5_9ACTN|nr:hypothetical protein [Nocardiopsis sinuspersici]
MHKQPQNIAAPATSESPGADTPPSARAPGRARGSGGEPGPATVARFVSTWDTGAWMFALAV